MNKFITGMTDFTNYAYTENGAVTHKTTKSDLLDMFCIASSVLVNRQQLSVI